MKRGKFSYSAAIAEKKYEWERGKESGIEPENEQENGKIEMQSARPHSPLNRIHKHLDVCARVCFVWTKI